MHAGGQSTESNGICNEISKLVLIKQVNLSRRRDLQKPTSMEVLSALRGRGADRRWGFGASCGLKIREETGRLSPPQSVTAFRLSSKVIGRCVPDYI